MFGNYHDKSEMFVLPTSFFVQLEKIFFDKCHLKQGVYCKLSEFLL